ncbi:MAG: InlB B-repeat-containing protein [Clostridia bacterium]|nr:InlB B-repeat-containing protein [Clostridia bacterium]
MTKTLKRVFGVGLAACVLTTFGALAVACGDPDPETPPPADDTTYTVKFDVQLPEDADKDATIKAPANQTVEKDGYATKPETPVFNYTFGGWYKEAACTNVFDFESEKIVEDTTVYAKWTKVEVPEFAFQGVKHIYMSGYEGTPNGDAYSTDNKYSEKDFKNPDAEPIEYTYNHITLAAGESVPLMWHLDGAQAGVQYKVDLRLGDEFKQDANVRAGINMYVQDLENSQSFEYYTTDILRKFGLIGLQIEFTEEQLTSLGSQGGAIMYKMILQNPTEIDFDLRIICSVGQSM